MLKIYSPMYRLFPDFQQYIRWSACWLIMCFFSSARAQDREIGKGISTFHIDPMGFCYFQKGDDIIKLNREQKEFVRFSMKDLGTPTSFDVSNPLRILVFYAEFAMVRVLDNNLIAQSELQLRPLGILQPRVMAGSPDQGIWVYDDISGTLSKINTQLGKAAVSVDLSQLLGKRPAPIALKAVNDWVVMLCPAELIVFDQFGTKVKTIPLGSPPSLFQLEESRLLYSQGDQLMVEDLRLRSFKSQLSPCKSRGENIVIFGNQCWRLDNQVLYLSQ